MRGHDIVCCEEAPSPPLVGLNMNRTIGGGRNKALGFNYRNVQVLCRRLQDCGRTNTDVDNRDRYVDGYRKDRKEEDQLRIR